MKNKIRIVLCILLPLQILFIKIISAYPEWIEKYYSQGVFPVTSKIERILLGWIPFSIGDILYALLIIFAGIWIYKRIREKFQNPQKWMLQLGTTASILYFAFHFLWGLNYYRLPLHESLGIEADYTTEELTELTELLVAKSNKIHHKITTDSTAAIKYDYTLKDIKKLSLQSYGNMKYTYPKLKHHFNSTKYSLFSLPLSYMGFSGYLNPLTNEAHLNAKVPPYKMPTLSTHEMAHQLGYAKENEANFVAALTTINHDNVKVNYSGYTFALQYCLSELYARDAEKAKELSKKINPGIQKNYQEVSDFWNSYKNPTEPFFKFFYGNYLKVNNQPKGMKSYNYVVALLVNYYKDERSL